MAHNQEGVRIVGGSFDACQEKINEAFPPESQGVHSISVSACDYRTGGSRFINEHRVKKVELAEFPIKCEDLHGRDWKTSDKPQSWIDHIPIKQDAPVLASHIVWDWARPLVCDPCVKLASWFFTGAADHPKASEWVRVASEDSGATSPRSQSGARWATRKFSLDKTALLKTEQLASHDCRPLCCYRQHGPTLRQWRAALALFAPLPNWCWSTRFECTFEKPVFQLDCLSQLIVLWYIYINLTPDSCDLLGVVCASWPNVVPNKPWNVFGAAWPRCGGWGIWLSDLAL